MHKLVQTTLLIFRLLLLTLAILHLTTAHPSLNPNPNPHSFPQYELRNETTPTLKRGIPYNDPTLLKFFSKSKISWMYNWDSRTAETHTSYEFVPMLHSAREDHTGRWVGDVKELVEKVNGEGDGKIHLLGFNEPDMCLDGAGGSCIDVDTAVKGWNKYIQPRALEYPGHVFLGSPAVTNGGPPMGLDWLSGFLKECSNCTVNFIAIHWYDSANNVPYFKKHIEDARKVAQGRPIWITEFKPRGTDEEVKKFLGEVLPWLDGQGDVHRYAYFMATGKPGMLVNAEGTELSVVGKAFSY